MYLHSFFINACNCLLRVSINEILRKTEGKKDTFSPQLYLELTEVGDLTIWRDTVCLS